MDSLILKDLPICKSYIDGKMTKRIKAKECLELVHTNLYGTFSVHAWGGYGYFITFIDDYSRFGYVHRKFDALDTFIEFKAGLDNLMGIHTKSLRLNQGDMSIKFDSLHWSTRLFPSYVHQGLHSKVERWKEDIKLGCT